MTSDGWRSVERHIPRENELTDEQQTLLFIEKYRSRLGWEPMTEEGSLADRLGPDVKLYRYREPGRQFAITAIAAVKDALVAAGAGGVQQFKRVPESEVVYYDVQLPPYTWAFI